MIHKIISNSVEETRNIGKRFARMLVPPKVIALQGELGSGKTEFVRGFVAGLDVSNGNVSSPTFMLWNLYDTGQYLVNHLDLYRLNTINDVLDLGIMDVWNSPNNFSLIEWAEKIVEILPDNALKIELKHINENLREIQISYLPEDFPDNQIKNL